MSGCPAPGSLGLQSWIGPPVNGLYSGVWFGGLTERERESLFNAHARRHVEAGTYGHLAAYNPPGPLGTFSQFGSLTQSYLPSSWGMRNVAPRYEPSAETLADPAPEPWLLPAWERRLDRALMGFIAAAATVTLLGLLQKWVGG
jgi:hypothetical protein